LHSTGFQQASCFGGGRAHPTDGDYWSGWEIEVGKPTQVPGIHGIVRIDRHAARDRPLPVRRHTDVDNRYGLPCSQKLLEFRSRDAVGWHGVDA